MINLAKLKKIISPSSFLIYNFFFFCLLFQIYLISQFPFLYHFLKILFYSELFALLLAFIQLAKENKTVALAFLLIITIRIPFYLQGDGLIFHSDNALEALQPLEIQDTHKAPFFLLHSSGHNGTLKYLWVAFIWDILGKSYVTFVLFQLIIFLLFIYLFYALFRRYVDELTARIFLLAHLAFVEVIFDYSLFLRAAPYLEMLTFFLLGLYLFDFSFRHKKKLILAYYFLLFSSYLHPLVIFLIIPFGLTAIVLSYSAGKLRLNLSSLLFGGATATFHLIYYKFFWPPPPPSGEWYRIIFFSPAQFSLSRLPLYLKNLVRDLWISFHHLFDFEFLYSLKFFQPKGAWVDLFQFLNRAIILLSLLAILMALFLSFRRLGHTLWRRPKELKEVHWPYLFLILTFFILVFKAFILSPRPYYEPRHNIDMAFWTGVGFLFFLNAIKLYRQPKFLSVLTVLLLLIFAVPHYFFYLKVASFKKESYRQLIPVLQANQVRYLATDFSLAYPIYFLTDRRVKVTDSLGPVSVPFFYYWLREEVDKIPWQKKAYLFFGDKYYRQPWHVKRTATLRKKIMDSLKKENIPYRIYNLPYYTIIIPRTAQNPAINSNQN